MVSCFRQGGGDDEEGTDYMRCGGRPCSDSEPFILPYSSVRDARGGKTYQGVIDVYLQ